MSSGPGAVGPEELANVDWHISSRSPNNGMSCVEAGPLRDGSGRVAVRHSHHPDGAAILYTRAEWEAFTAGVRLGEFDFSTD
ncbi:MAG: DUF397 domain-containing protein [Pseudonocardiaceae bacterium]